MLGVTVIFQIPPKAAICSQALIIIKMISFCRKFAAVNPVSLLPLSLLLSLEHYSEPKLEEYLLYMPYLKLLRPGSKHVS